MGRLPIEIGGCRRGIAIGYRRVTGAIHSAVRDAVMIGSAMHAMNAAVKLDESMRVIVGVGMFQG